MKVTFYAQLEPTHNYRDEVNGARVARVTSKRPERPVGGTVVTKITLEVDPAVFGPLEAKGRLDADGATVIPLTVQAPEATSG